MMKRRVNVKVEAFNETIQIGDHCIKFPYVPYSCQRDFMAKVVEALDSTTNAALESPTGTGKTLSLLCSAIAWVQSQKEKIRLQQHQSLLTLYGPKQTPPQTMQQYPKIYYASRTHSQLQQVIRELNKTAYKSAVRVTTLAGRDQLCLNEEVLKEQNKELRAHMCRSLTKHKTCVFHSNMNEVDPDILDQIYLKKFRGVAMDIEDLVSFAQTHRHCPFYRARHMCKDADLILLPYNYLLDPEVRQSFAIQLKGNILIFDEAHNMEKIAEESISVDFSTKTLAIAIDEAKQVLEMVIEEEEEMRQQMDENGESFAELGKKKWKSKRGGGDEEEDEKKLPKKEDVALLLAMLQSFEEKIDALDLESGGRVLPNLDGKVFPGYKMIELMRSAEIHRHQRDQIGFLIDRIGLYLAKNASDKNGIWTVRGTSLMEFSTLVSRVFIDTFEGVRFPSTATAAAAKGNLSSIQQQQGNESSANQDASGHFQLFIETTNRKEGHLDDEKGGKGITLHYWCFNAGVAMRYLESRGTLSIVLASGTLAPLGTFLATMGIHFGAIFESAHCARQDNLVVGIVTKGPNNAQLLGTFENRNTTNYKQAIGELLLQLVRVTPQGMLVFFPSYGQMSNFIDHWKGAKTGGGRQLWDELDRQKRIFAEPKDKTDIPALFRDFDAAVRNPGGAILLAICRGKLSEGIDFADSHCRSVVIVGIPFPPLFDPRVLLKKAHLIEQCKRRKIKNTMHSGKLRGPDEWYKNEATRAVNQALGRIIRHKDDFGTVILADSRYAEMNHQAFPSWIRCSIQTYQFSDSILPSIQRFFAERGILVERSKQKANDESVMMVDRKRGSLSTFYDHKVENGMKRKRDDTKESTTIQMLQIYAKDLGIEQPKIEDGIEKNELADAQLPIHSQQNVKILREINREKKRKICPKVQISDDYFDA